MYKFEDFVPSQYLDSKNLKAVANIFLSRYIAQEKTIKQIDELTTLETAKGKNLDDLGDIIGYKRPYRAKIITEDLQYFVFEGGFGLGFSSVSNPTEGGVWWSLKDTGQGAELLDDELYRYLLKLKAIKNRSKGTPNEIIGAVMAISGVVPTLVEDNANIDLTIPGLSSGVIDLRDLYENFLPRPLGVSLTIIDGSFTTPLIHRGRYTGTNAPQDITVTGADFDEGEYFCWIKSVDAIGPHSILSTLMGLGAGFHADTENGMRLPIELKELTGDTMKIEAGDNINALGVEYEYQLYKMRRGIRRYTNHNLLYYSAFNDLSGQHNIYYTGSGKEGHIVEIPPNKYPIFAAIKDIDEHGGWTVITSQTFNQYLDISLNEPLRVDTDMPNLLPGGITFKKTLNKMGHRYLVWLMTFSNLATRIYKYTGDGVVDRVIQVGNQPDIVFIKKLNDYGNWVVATDLFTSGETMNFNTAEAVSTTNKFSFTGNEVTLSDHTDVNENGSTYIMVTLLGN